MRDELDADTIAWRKSLTEKICSREDFNQNSQYVHTPFELCYQMVERLEWHTGLHNKTFLTFNLEFVDTLCYDFGIRKDQIWFVTDCKEKALICEKHPRYKGVNVACQNYLLWEINTMKFDVIVGNPPYQAPQKVKNKKGELSYAGTLWDKFVINSITSLKNDGYLCMVHPSGWRGLGKKSAAVKESLNTGHFHFLEIHNEKDGLDTFGAETRYDWYVWQKCKIDKLTTVIGQDGVKHDINIGDLPFLPNGMIQEIIPLIATNGEEKVEIINDYSYGVNVPTDHMSENRTKSFKYPCVYSINSNGIPKLRYSSTNQFGHFGIPKVIFSGGRISSANFVEDENGEYGMTQWAKGIVDLPKNIKQIANAMRTEKFKRIMEMCSIGLLEIDKNILSSFRKDFWKHFIA